MPMKVQSNDAGVAGAARDMQLITPRDVDREFTIPEGTQAVWRSTNRYGFRDLVIKVGTNVRYRRGDVERWLESRRASALDARDA